MSKGPNRRISELTWIGAFVGLNLVAPFVFGEMFPITVSPMFCDEPSCYCEYEVTDDQGKPLELKPLGLHRVYDGNPVGLGVGLVAPKTLDEFGKVPTEEQLRRHLQDCRDVWSHSDYLDVTLIRVGDVEGRTVGPTSSIRFRVEPRNGP